MTDGTNVYREERITSEGGDLDLCVQKGVTHYET